VHDYQQLQVVILWSVIEERQEDLRTLGRRLLDT
jgi:hypothetical protein